MDLKDQYIAKFPVLEQDLNGQKHSGLHKVRKKALDDFEKLGFPTPKTEEWKYTRIERVVKEQFEPYLPKDQVVPTDADLGIEMYPSIEANKLVFVNGFYSQAHSTWLEEDDKVFVKSFSELEDTTNESIQYLAQNTDQEKEAFTALNTAFFQDGALLHLGKNTELNHPLMLIFVSAPTGTKYLSQPRNLIIADEGSKATVIEDYQTIDSDEDYFTNELTEIVLKPNARVDHYKMMIQPAQLNLVNSVQVHQQRDSRYNCYNFTLRGQLIRNNYYIQLAEEGAECDVNGLYYTREQDHADNHVLIEHKVPQCQSNQFFKGLLDGKSTGVFNGKVYVHPHAQKTNAYQSDKNILLSDKATINAKPELEIYADDVTCSHGATSGQLDKNQVFYLMARGLDKERAKALLTEAFALEVTDKVELESVNKVLREKLSHILALNN